MRKIMIVMALALAALFTGAGAALADPPPDSPSYQIPPGFAPSEANWNAHFESGPPAPDNQWINRYLGGASPDYGLTGNPLDRTGHSPRN